VPAALRAEGIEKNYGATPVLENVSFNVNGGSIMAITGENGAGKSTLLGICAGLLRADAGTVSVTGAVGFCPQSPSLFELLTADDHLVIFGRAAGFSRAEALSRGRSLLDEFGFPLGQNVATRDLSGGTRQKLNLAIALLPDPDVLLLDEPYQGFDHGTYVNFWDHCRAWADRGKAVVVVTHMLAELARVDELIELPPHPSRGARR
jgi:ABC-2 type transport system ATP-binding protein